MKGKHLKSRRILYFALACAIPALMWANVLSGPQVTQNRYTVLTSDLNGQYISYLMYFRNTLAAGKSFSYSFSALLGNGMAALSGYYLMSPLNFLVLLFPAEELSRAAYWILLIRIGLAGTFAGWLFGRKRDYHFSALLYSTTYALSGYTFAYFMHLMWMDSVVLLPLAAIGIEKLVDERKPVFYCLMMAANLMICYYTGYMAAGFCLLYFLFLLLKKKQNGRDNLHLILAYAACTLLSGMLSAVVLLPTLLSQAAGGNTSSALAQTASLAEIAGGLVTGGASEEAFQNGGPHLYVGTMMLFLFILYFFPHNKEEKRESLAAAAVSLLFLASILSERLNLVWHLFSAPHGFPYRYAFVIVLFILLIAESSSRQRLKEMKGKQAVLAAVILSALILIGHNASGRKTAFLVIDLLWTFFTCGALYVLHFEKEQRRKSLRIVLCAGQACMLSLNGFDWVSIHQFDDHSADGFYDRYHGIASNLQHDDELFRMEKTFSESENDALLLGYPGMSFYSSSDLSSSRHLLGALGYSENYMWAAYGSGGGLAADSFFSLRYLLSQNEIPSLENSLFRKIDDLYVYENSYVLPFGFAAKGNIADADWGKDVFENQEKLYGGVLNEQVSFFNLQDQAQIVQADNVSIEQNDVDGNRLSRIDADQDGSVRYTFSAQIDGPAYLYLYDTNLAGITVSVNGSKAREYATAERHGILPLGSYEKGDLLQIDLYIGKDPLVFSRMEIASMNLPAFYDAAAKIRQSGWNIVHADRAAITADVTAEDDVMLLTTIPYDEGWKVELDGKSVSVQKAFNALLCFPLAKGSHRITMHYEVKGLVPGALLSIAAAFLLIVLCAKKRKGGA